MKLGRACLAGAVGTAAMTTLMLALPHVGLPRMAIGEMLGSASALTIGYTAIGATVGWIIHGVVGVVLAVLYARFIIHFLPGSPLTRGLVFGVILFCIAQIVFMPVVGAGFISRGDFPMLLGSLLGHLVYGGLVGTVYGGP